MELSAFSDRLYTELSGGERQRVHFARALCQLMSAGRDAIRSTMLLLDEPTSNLDLGHQMLLMGRARQEAEAGRIVIAVLHDLNLAATWADEVVLLGDGRIAAQGRPEDIFRDRMLSDLYGCDIIVNRVPAKGVPFMLPQAMVRRGSLAVTCRTA